VTDVSRPSAAGRARRSPRMPESLHQAQIMNLLRSIGAQPFTIGTRRRRGDFQGTCQTPGLPDIFSFLPAPPLSTNVTPALSVWVEVKGAGGRLRPEQIAFRAQCERARQAYVVGGVDQVASFLISGGWLKADNVAHYRRT
jgi:hypothetical protein